MKELRIPVPRCLPPALPGAVSARGRSAPQPRRAAARSTPSPGKSFALVPGPDSTAESCHPSSLPWPRAALRPVLWFMFLVVFFFPAGVFLFLFCLIFFLQMYTIIVFVPGKDGEKALQECRYTSCPCVCMCTYMYRARLFPAQGALSSP